MLAETDFQNIEVDMQNPKTSTIIALLASHREANSTIANLNGTVISLQDDIAGLQEKLTAPPQPEVSAEPSESVKGG